MGVLAMIEIDGDPRLIAAAIAELERLLPPAPGLLARIVAPTDDRQLCRSSRGLGA